MLIRPTNVAAVSCQAVSPVSSQLASEQLVGERVPLVGDVLHAVGAALVACTNVWSTRDKTPSCRLCRVPRREFGVFREHGPGTTRRKAVFTAFDRELLPCYNRERDRPNPSRTGVAR